MQCSSSQFLAFTHIPCQLMSEQTSVQFSCSVMSNCLRPHELQHARPPCPSLSLRVCSNSCRVHDVIQPSHLCCPLLLLPSIFSSIKVFSNKLVLRIRKPKYWSFSFSISPSNEYLRLVSFTIDCFDLCSPRDSQESSPEPQFERINSLVLSLCYGPTLTSIHDYRKNHINSYRLLKMSY